MVGNGSSSEQLGAAPGRSAVDGVLVMSDNLPQSGGMGVGSWGGGGGDRRGGEGLISMLPAKPYMHSSPLSGPIEWICRFK